MGTKTKILFILLWSVFPATNGFTDAPASGDAPKAKLVLRNLVAKDGRIEGDISLSKSPNGKVQIQSRQSITSEVLAVRTHATPVNLWILVDASQLCQLNKIDQYLGAQLNELKATLHPKSLLSVVSFTSSTLEIAQNHRAISDVEDINLHCDPKLLSTSYEKALTRLMESRQDETMTTMVWIYTSGNVSLSDKMVEALKAKNINLHLILYNAILENDIRPLVDQTNMKLGNDRVQLSVLNPQNGFVPERWMGISVDSPRFFEGGSLPFTVTASIDGKEVASEQATVSVPVPGSLWRRYRIWILGLVSALLIGYLAYRLVRFYQAKFCKVCRRRTRHQDQTCLFCPNPGQAFLVGRFNTADRRKFNRVDVLPLVSPVIELGNHRRSKVKWLRVPGKRRLAYLTIERNSVLGKYAYRAKGNPLGNVQVNGVILANPRYLAPGDEIQIDGVSMTFVCRRSADESTSH